MFSSLNKKAVAGATGIAVLAGAGGAYAVTRGSSATAAPAAATSRTAAKPDPAAARNAFLDDVAKRLQVSRDQLDSALKGAASDRVDAAVAAGRLTKAQGDAIKRRIQQGAGAFRGVPFFGHRGPGHAGPGFRLGFGRRKSLDAAATYLGLTDAQLRQRIRSGKSLAQITKDEGKSVVGLEQAIRDAVQTQLDQAVKDGRLTGTQRTDLMTRFNRNLDDIVNQTPPARPFFRHP